MSPETILQEIPVDSIVEAESQIRSVIVLEGLQELAESIKSQGIIEPIIVVKKGDKYEIRAGHRRYLAAKIAGLGTIPCLVRALDVKNADLLMLHENFFREDINPVDEAKFFVKLHDKHNLAYTEIAHLCSRSETYVMNRVRLLECDERILATLEAGQINFSQACEISRAPNESIGLELLRITVESGATVETLRMMRHDYERRLSNQDPALVEAPPAAGHYPDVKHLIICPTCNGSYPVNQMYPLSTCKTCYDGILAGVKEAQGGHK